MKGPDLNLAPQSTICSYAPLQKLRTSFLTRKNPLPPFQSCALVPPDTKSLSDLNLLKTEIKH